MSHQFMAFEIADVVAREFQTKKKKRQNISNLFFLLFNSVHIPQSLEITDAKISLQKVPLKVTSCQGSS